MKKKVISLWLVGFVLLSTGLLCACQSFRSLGISTGRCLITEDGACLLICDNTPIILSNRSKNPDLFTGLDSGDKIRMVHDGIQESYPARTGAYALRKISDGDINDISLSVLTTLAELGWSVPSIPQ